MMLVGRKKEENEMNKTITNNNGTINFDFGFMSKAIDMNSIILSIQKFFTGQESSEYRILPKSWVFGMDESTSQEIGKFLNLLVYELSSEYPRLEYIGYFEEQFFKNFDQWIQKEGFSKRSKQIRLFEHRVYLGRDYFNLYIPTSQVSYEVGIYKFLKGIEMAFKKLEKDVR